MSDTTPTAQAVTQRPTTPIVNSVGGKLLATVLQEIRNLDRPWANTPEHDQQRVIDRVRTATDAAVRTAVNGVAQCGFPFAVGTLESLAIKDGVKAAVKFGRGTEEIHQLMDSVGTSVLIVFADPAQFTHGMERIKADVDQPELPLEELRDNEALFELLASLESFENCECDAMRLGIEAWSDEERASAKAWAQQGALPDAPPDHVSELITKATMEAAA